jgi:hypothetical protein
MIDVEEVVGVFLFPWYPKLVCPFPPQVHNILRYPFA